MMYLQWTTIQVVLVDIDCYGDTFCTCQRKTSFRDFSLQERGRDMLSQRREVVVILFGILCNRAMFSSITTDFFIKRHIESRTHGGIEPTYFLLTIQTHVN